MCVCVCVCVCVCERDKMHLVGCGIEGTTEAPLTNEIKQLHQSNRNKTSTTALYTIPAQSDIHVAYKDHHHGHYSSMTV